MFDLCNEAVPGTLLSRQETRSPRGLLKAVAEAGNGLSAKQGEALVDISAPSASPDGVARAALARSRALA